MKPGVGDDERPAGAQADGGVRGLAAATRARRRSRGRGTSTDAAAPAAGGSRRLRAPRQQDRLARPAHRGRAVGAARPGRRRARCRRRGPRCPPVPRRPRASGTGRGSGRCRRRYNSDARRPSANGRTAVEAGHGGVGDRIRPPLARSDGSRRGPYGRPSRGRERPVRTGGSARPTRAGGVDGGPSRSASRAPAPPQCVAIISAAIDTAVSSGVRAPEVEPDRATTSGPAPPRSARARAAAPAGRRGCAASPSRRCRRPRAAAARPPAAGRRTSGRG